MGSIGDVQSPVSDAIPIVDFSRWHDSKHQTDRLSVAKDLTDACRTVGFVYIINHGVSQTLIDEAFATAKRLYALSHEEKMRAPHPDGPQVHRGYSYPGLEKVYSEYSVGDEAEGEKLREVRDCKESYEIGSDENELQPNVWFPESTLPDFRTFTTKFYWECNKLAQDLLRAIALGIGLHEEFFIKYHRGHRNQLRLLHYPPIPASEIEAGSAARMPSHRDWGSITLLFQDDCGGLEIENPHSPGKFVPATPVPGACIVNIGDMLMRWSNDYLKSAQHRVTLPPLSDRYEGDQRMTRARYSIPYFVITEPDTVIECLPECIDAQHPPKYEPVTQEEYGRMRGKLMYRSKAEE